MTRAHRHLGWLFALLAVLASPFRGRTQSFRNLDFERANVPLYPADVATSNAMPGWQAYIDDVETDWVVYDSVGFGGALVTIHDVQGESNVPVLQGNYTVFLQGHSIIPDYFASIGQQGTIPADARSVRFITTWVPVVALSFAGQEIPLFRLGSSQQPSYVLVGDISQFAGQTGELRFTGGGAIDDIQFSSKPAPVPLTIRACPTNTLVLSWPAPTDWFLVQACLDLPASNWANLTNAPVAIESGSQITIPFPTKPTFFRLVSQ